MAKTKIFNRRAQERMRKWDRDRIRKLRCRHCKHENTRLAELERHNKVKGYAWQNQRNGGISNKMMRMGGKCNKEYYNRLKLR